MYDLPLRHAPEAIERGHAPFAVELVFNGGTGARPASDGLSATAYPSGVWGSQIETTEAAAPVFFHKRALLADTGGAGRWRGGMGQRIEMSPAGQEDIMLFLSVERVRNPARGRHGGSDGAPGRIRITGHDGDLPGKGTFQISAGQTLIFDTPGGGGFGPADERAAEKVQRDAAEGLVSAKAAKEIYGRDV